MNLDPDRNHRMSSHPESGDGLDPVVAEHFDRLHRVPVPDIDMRAAVRAAERAPGPTIEHPTDGSPATATPALTHLSDAPSRRFEPPYVLAAAAAIVMIAAASYLALRPNPPVNLDATSGATDVDTTVQEPTTPQTAAVQDGSGTSELTVEVPPSSAAPSSPNQGGTDTNPAGSGESEGGEPGADPAEQGSPTTSVAAESTGDNPGVESTIADATPPDEDESTPPTMDPDEVLTPPTTTGEVVTPDVPPTSMVPDGADRMIIIRGTLTELFTDCQAHYRLAADGSVELAEAVTCDGGSYVVVDGNRVQTSAGYVPGNQYYNRHNPNLRPGQRVVVSAVASNQRSLTLACSQCGIALGG